MSGPAMSNARIADVFDQLSDLLEFQGANAFRVRAYRNGARAIRDHSQQIADIVADPARKLTDIDGIGSGVAEKCAVLLDTGRLPQLDELLEKIPDTVLDMMRIPGLGPKKAAALHKELGICDLDQLQAACEQGQVRDLKGFGAKTEQTILSGIQLARTAGDRLLWATADELAGEVRRHMNACDAIKQLELAGSYRRGKETVGDLDVLVDSVDVEAVMDHFARFPELQEVLARGDTKMSIRTLSGFQIDLRVVPTRSFGAALQYFTGSKEHNVELRGRAKQRGLKVNEYGVFRVSDDQYLAGASEEEVYAALDLPCFPPELREARREFEWAEQGELPQLVQLTDIRGDLHMHTTETDGKASLDEMIEAARQRGLQYIAITDHSQRVTMARGLDPGRLRRQWTEIDQRNQQLGSAFLVLKGIECDILEKGGMDLPDDVLAEADWVLASVHYGQNQSRQQITERVLEAIENPHVSCVAHPTGRLINRREAYDLDVEAMFLAARRHGKLLELNAHPRRLDLNDVLCAAAKSHGIPIVISSDAHAADGLDVMRYGVLQARRGGLTPKDVANTGGWLELKQLIGRQAS